MSSEDERIRLMATEAAHTPLAHPVGRSGARGATPPTGGAGNSNSFGGSRPTKLRRAYVDQGDADVTPPSARLWRLMRDPDVI